MSEKVCSFCGSSENYYAKGLCLKCYNRNRRNGSPEYKKRVYQVSENTKRILYLRADGMGLSDIARKVGVSKQRVAEVVYKRYKKNNADKIRSMSNSDLANLLCDHACFLCPIKEGCLGRMEEGRNSCYKRWLKWLETEVET